MWDKINILDLFILKMVRYAYSCQHKITLIEGTTVFNLETEF